MISNQVVSYAVGVYNQIPPEVWQTVLASLVTLLPTQGIKNLGMYVLRLEKGVAGIIAFVLAAVIVAAAEYVWYQNKLPKVVYGVDILGILAFGTAAFHVVNKLNDKLGNGILSKYQFNFSVKKRVIANPLIPTPSTLPSLATEIATPPLEMTGEVPSATSSPINSPFDNANDF